MSRRRSDILNAADLQHLRSETHSSEVRGDADTACSSSARSALVARLPASPASAPRPDELQQRRSDPARRRRPPARPRPEPQVTELLTGLTSPWGLVALRDGSLLISERDTRRILVADGR